MVMRPVSRRRFLQLAGGGVAATMLSDSIARALAIPANRATAVAAGRRAHRRPDAGEPVVRPLLRHDARRPRVRRPAPGDAAERQAGLAPGRRRHRGAAVPPRRCDDLGADVPRGPRPRLGPDAPGVQRRQLRPVGAGQDHHDAWRTCSARTSRSTTRWPTPSPSATPTTARCSARPTPTATTCGPAGRQRRQGRRPGHRQRRARLRLDDLPGAAAGRPGITWKIYQDIGDGLDAAGFWGWTSIAYIGNYGDNSLLYFNNYQNAAPGQPAVQTGPHRHRRQQDAATASSTSSRADVKRGRLPQVSWIVGARGVHRAPELARRTTAPGTSAGCSTR